MPIFMGLLRHPNISALEIDQDIFGLGKVLTHEKSKELRREAAAALGRIGDERSVSFLISVLLHENEDTRLFAAEALGEIGDPRAVEPLITTLKDNDHMVRCAAANALGKLKDARAIGALHEILDDTYEEVQQAAEEALCNIDDEECEAPFFAKHGYQSNYKNV